MTINVKCMGGPLDGRDIPINESWDKEGVFVNFKTWGGKGATVNKWYYNKQSEGVYIYSHYEKTVNGNAK